MSSGFDPNQPRDADGRWSVGAVRPPVPGFYESVAPRLERIKAGRMTLNIGPDTHPDLVLYRGEPRGVEVPFRAGDGAAGPGTYLAVHKKKAEIFAGPAGEVREFRPPAGTKLLRVPANESVYARAWNEAARGLGYSGLWIEGQGEVVLFSQPAASSAQAPWWKRTND